MLWVEGGVTGVCVAVDAGTGDACGVGDGAGVVASGGVPGCVAGGDSAVGFRGVVIVVVEAVRAVLRQWRRTVVSPLAKTLWTMWFAVCAIVVGGGVNIGSGDGVGGVEVVANTVDGAIVVCGMVRMMVWWCGRA